MSAKQQDSNQVLDFALSYKYPEYSVEKGINKVVAFGDHSHKCPTYVKRIPPCSGECPAGEDIRGYHNLLRGVEKSDNKWEAAWRRLVETNPFPAIMGRVCPHPCESKCNRGEVDEAVGINAVEHAIGDYGIKNNLQFEKPDKKTGKKIAVIGGGPAGLSASYQLAKKGHSVTIIEAQEKLGGMVRYGIMGYRVDRKVLETEVQRILNLGIEIRFNTAVGKDIPLEKLQKDFDAVFVGVGAQKGRGLPIPGFKDTDMAANAIDFLMDFEKNGEAVKTGKNVIVIGDGNVAMDVARLAIRLGAKATVIAGVQRNEMACFPEEMEDTVIEGGEVVTEIGTVEVIQENGKITGLKCIKMQKKDKGEEGFNSPIPFLRYKPIPGTEFTIDCDMVVASIGQATELTGLEATTGGKPWLNVDKNYQIKGLDGVFGGGDAIKVDLITTAVGHGRKAAEAIHQHVMGQPLPLVGYRDIIPLNKMASYYFPAVEKNQRGHQRPSKVVGNFDEILLSLDPETVTQESERCMSCGLCFECKQCMLFCPQEAISMFKENAIGEVMFTDYNRCIGCHICSLVCPSGYIHMGMGEDL